MSDMLNAALVYIRRGVAVFPLVDKKPITAHGFKDASTDEDQVRRWWQSNPDAQIGVPTGRRIGLLAIDIDPRHGGDETLAELQNGSPIPEGPVTVTGSGGRHIWFKDDTRFTIGAGKGDLAGVDFRGEGGYVVAAPSIHASGKPYIGEVPAADAAPTIPEWLASAILVNKRAKIDTTVGGPKILQGTMNDTFHAIATRLRKQGLEYEEILGVLISIAQSRCDPVIDVEDPSERAKIEGIAQRAAGYSKSIEIEAGEESLARIRERNPEMKIMTPEEIEADIVAKAETVTVRGNSELNALPHRPAPKMYRASELIETYKNVKLPWVSQGLLLRGEVTLVVGSAKIGKSTLLLQLLQRVTTGGEWAFSKKAIKVQHPAIYYSLEMGEVSLAKRMAQLFGHTFPDNLWVVPARDYTIDWDEIGEKVSATEASVVVIDNLLGTNIGDINKAEVAAKVMNEAFAFAQERSVAVVVVHHTRKGPRILEGQQQQGDPLDEAHGSKVFANKAGILIFLRKTTGGKRNTYADISVVSRFGESKTIKAIFDRSQKGKWRRRTQADQSEEDQDVDLESEEDESLGTDSVPKDVLPNSKGETVQSPEVIRNVPNLGFPNHSDAKPTRDEAEEQVVSVTHLVTRSQISGVENMLRGLRAGIPHNDAPLWGPLDAAIKAGMSDDQILAIFREASQ